MNDGDALPTITGLVGVYNAKGTTRGEIAYLLGKLRGVAHCGLCDITHGRVRESAAWKQVRDSLPVAFETYHLDDQPSEIRAVSAGRTPAVFAMTATGPVLLLGPAELDACEGSPDLLVDAINRAAAEHGLTWP